MPHFWPASVLAGSFWSAVRTHLIEGIEGAHSRLLTTAKTNSTRPSRCSAPPPRPGGDSLPGAVSSSATHATPRTPNTHTPRKSGASLVSSLPPSPCFCAAHLGTLLRLRRRYGRVAPKPPRNGSPDGRRKAQGGRRGPGVRGGARRRAGGGDHDSGDDGGGEGGGERKGGSDRRCRGGGER